MTNIFDVARYTLAKMGEMSTMKLQKLCYYAQAWSLVWDDKPLFDEEFEAWRNGPVCPELFQTFKGRFSVAVSDVPVTSLSGDELSDNQKDSIDKVLQYYGGKNAQWLSRLTHLEDPWIKARDGLGDGDPGNEIITKESMGEYYGAL